MRVVTDRPTAGNAARLPARPVTAVLTGAGGSLAPLAVTATVVATATFAFSLAVSRRTPMWLDEAQTVSIARLPVGPLLHALRTDGSPPLYYLLLHAWTALLGHGDTAARSLSAVFAVAAVPAGTLAAARVGGRRAAVAAAALLASLPFLHRYATEARMYSLVVLLSALGFLAIHEALERPRRGALAGVAAVTAALLLTHYWTMFLLVVVAAVVLACGRRQPPGDPGRLAARRVVGAMAVGGLAFLPWVPSFLYQLAHTGAPWGIVAGAWMFESSLHGLVGEQHGLGLLGFAYPVLALLGLCALPLPGGALEIDLAGRPPGRALAAVVAGTLGLALVVSRLTGSAFAPRYAAVVVVPFVVLAARGLATVEHPQALRIAAAVLVGVGLFRSYHEVGAPRSQARQLGRAVAERAQPGDLLVVCPDQVAPALAREVPDLPATVVYPPGSAPDRVDWVDYTQRVRAGDPSSFAAAAAQQAGGGTVWMVWSGGYHGLDHTCQRIFTTLRSLRPAAGRVVATNYRAFEHATLWRFPPDQ